MKSATKAKARSGNLGGPEFSSRRCYGEQVVASGTTIVKPGCGVVVAKPDANGPNVGPARLLTRAPTPQVLVAVSAEAGTTNATDKPSTSEAMMIRRLYICTLPLFQPTAAVWAEGTYSRGCRQPAVRQPTLPRVRLESAKGVGRFNGIAPHFRPNGRELLGAFKN